MEIYKPNIGWIFWAILILILAVVLPLIIIFRIVAMESLHMTLDTYRMVTSILIVVAAILLVIMLLSMLALLRTMYTLDDHEMKLSGIFGQRNIQYSAVTKVIDSNKFVIDENMFVLSTERVVIVYGDKKVSTAPRDKQDMLASLKTKCPNAGFEENLAVDKSGKRVKERKPLIAAKEPSERKPTEQKQKDPMGSKLKLPGFKKK